MSKLIKVLVATSLASLGVTFLSVIIAFAIIQKRDAQAKLPPGGPNGTATASADRSFASLLNLTSAEVSRHNSPSDCWLIINDSVYNVTSFLAVHPGGSFVITPYCGKDATHAFNTKDKTPVSRHSATAIKMLSTYFLGKLGSSIAGGKLPVNATPTSVQLAALLPTRSSSSVATSLAATHSTASDCWITIAGNVYNVTSFLNQHPGGSFAITPYCGKDATQAFATKDKTPGVPHSAYAISLLANYLVGSQGSGGTSSVPIAIPTRPPAASPTTPPASGGQTYTTAEVATHNTASNCWLIISGKIYNVTSFLTQHPGGVSVITAYCGQDATNAFATRGGRGSNHSAYAYSLLNNYYIGALAGGGGGGTTSGPAPTNTPVPAQPTSAQGTLPASVSAKYPGATIQSQNIEDNGSQELQILTNGSCRHIKVNSSGTITEDQSC